MAISACWRLCSNRFSGSSLKTSVISSPIGGSTTASGITDPTCSASAFPCSPTVVSTTKRRGPVRVALPTARASTRAAACVCATGCLKPMLTCRGEALFLRIGRQNLSWGETDAFRLLDQINPLDASFGGFLVSLDDRRVPLDMVRAVYSFEDVGPFSELNIESYGAFDKNISSPVPVGSPWSTPNPPGMRSVIKKAGPEFQGYPGWLPRHRQSRRADALRGALLHVSGCARGAHCHAQEASPDQPGGV